MAFGNISQTRKVGAAALSLSSAELPSRAADAREALRSPASLTESFAGAPVQVAADLPASELARMAKEAKAAERARRPEGEKLVKSIVGNVAEGDFKSAFEAIKQASADPFLSGYVRENLPKAERAALKAELDKSDLSAEDKKTVAAVVLTERQAAASVAVTGRELDSKITEWARSSSPSAKTDAINAVNEAAKDPVLLAYLQKHVGKDEKALLLETPGLTDDQKRDLASKLYSKEELAAASKVKELFEALQKPDAVIAADTFRAIRAAASPDSSVINTILANHPDLKMAKSPSAILAGAYSNHAEKIDGDTATSRAFKDLELAFPKSTK